MPFSYIHFSAAYFPVPVQRHLQSVCHSLVQILKPANVIVLFNDTDLDLADLRHLLALHGFNNPLIPL